MKNKVEPGKIPHTQFRYFFYPDGKLKIMCATNYSRKALLKRLWQYEGIIRTLSARFDETTKKNIKLMDDKLCGTY